MDEHLIQSQRSQIRPLKQKNRVKPRLIHSRKKEKGEFKIPTAIIYFDSTTKIIPLSEAVDPRPTKYTNKKEIFETQQCIFLNFSLNYILGGRVSNTPV